MSRPNPEYQRFVLKACGSNTIIIINNIFRQDDISVSVTLHKKYLQSAVIKYVADFN